MTGSANAYVDDFVSREGSIVLVWAEDGSRVPLHFPNVNIAQDVVQTIRDQLATWKGWSARPPECPPGVSPADLAFLESGLS